MLSLLVVTFRHWSTEEGQGKGGGGGGTMVTYFLKMGKITTAILKLDTEKF